MCVLVTTWLDRSIIANATSGFDWYKGVGQTGHTTTASDSKDGTYDDH